MHTHFLADNKRPKHGQFGREFSRVNTSRPQPQTFMFQSSTVTYGGPNGACYTSSTTRRTGADGVSISHECYFFHLYICRIQMCNGDHIC
jgi:hypothetical protein